MFSKICMRMPTYSWEFAFKYMYLTIIVSIAYQILPCKIYSKKNSEDQKSKKHPKHNGFENDETNPFKCTELTDASPQYVSNLITWHQN